MNCTEPQDFYAQKLSAAEQFINGIYTMANASQANFVDLPYEGCICLQKPGGKTTPIADVAITGICTVYTEGEAQPTAICIRYIRKYADFNRVYAAVIPAYEYAKRKILRHFPDIIKKPGCSDGLLQDLLFWLVQQFPAKSVYIIPKHAGWTTINQKLEFCADQTVIPLLQEYYPEAVKKRQVPTLTMTQPEIVEQLNKLFETDCRVGLLGAFRTLAVLYPILMEKIILPK